MSPNSEDETVLASSVEKDGGETVVMLSGDADDETVVAEKSGVTQQKGALSIGSILKDRFTLKEILGSGGMGTVYRATDRRREEAQDHQPDVAIKILNEEFRHDTELFIALQRETKKSQLLAHPNIVTVYDFDRDGEYVFMVMELLEGKPLSDFIKGECSEGVDFKEAWPIFEGLISALSYAHEKSIIHSDFKPGNIMLTKEGKAKVLDFGIACAIVNSEMDQADTVFNARDLGALTPAYASLEMFQGKNPEPADDVYALACVCYEVLTGKHPYGKLSAEKALELNLEPKVIDGLPRRQRLAMSHALMVKAEQRTITVDDFFAEIKPKSIWPKVLAGIAVTASLVGAYNYYGVAQEVAAIDDIKATVKPLTPLQRLAVKDNLELAQIHFEVGFLIAPPGSNARWAYRKVLEMDPLNQDASKGLQEIADILENQAIDLYEKGRYKKSLEKVNSGLETVPKDEALLGLKEKLLNVSR